jgi:hypothetical protein
MNIRQIAKRMTSAPGWRWLPGMACEWEDAKGAGGHQCVVTMARVTELPMGSLPATYGLLEPNRVPSGAWPCLDDQATVGAIMMHAIDVASPHQPALLRIRRDVAPTMENEQHWSVVDYTGRLVVAGKFRPAAYPLLEALTCILEIKR